MTEVALIGGWRDWRNAPDDPDPDDELIETPEDVTNALGFDPALIDKFGHDDLRKAVKQRRISVDPKRKAVTDAQAKLATVWKKHMAAIGNRVAAAVNSKLAGVERVTADQAKKAAEIAHGVDLSGLNILIDPTAEALSAMAQDSGSETVAQLQLDDPQDLFERVNNRAAAWAKDRAAELVGMKYDEDGNLVTNPNAKYAIDDTTRDKLQSIIADGLANGDGNEDITDRIEDEGFGEDRAQLIAFTEIARANSQGALASYKEAADDGVNIQKEWLTAEDDLVCEDICSDNADEGPIDLDDDFQSGDDATPGHPRCRCRIVGVISDDQGNEQDDGEEATGDEE